MPKVNFRRQLAQIDSAIDKEIKSAAIVFHSSIKTAWPKDTGFSKDMWMPPIKIEDGYEVYNPVSYSPILWYGRHDIGGRSYGSEQMPNGGAPILDATLDIMLSRIKAL